MPLYSGSVMKVKSDPTLLFKKQYAAKKLAPQKEGYFAPRAVNVREHLLCANAEEVFLKLKEFGMAIMPNMLSAEKCKMHYEGIVRDCEKLVPSFKGNDLHTWANFRRDTLAKAGMICQNWGIPWSQSVCDLRGEDEIIDFWVNLWNAMDKKHVSGGKRYEKGDLLCSSDAAALSLNHSGCKFGWDENMKPNLHIDKSRHEVIQRICHIQSFINLLPSQDGGACFKGVENSHGRMEEFVKAFPGTMEASFNQIQTQKQLDWFLNKGCRIVNVRAEVGDCVLWTSTLVHCGCAPTMPVVEMSKIDQDHHVPKIYKRCVAYISMQPRRYASAVDLANKVKAFKTFRGTGHRAAKGVSLFPLEARLYGKKSSVKTLDVHPVLSKQSQRMYGLI
jgi:hypothetical protein